MLTSMCQLVNIFVFYSVSNLENSYLTTPFAITAMEVDLSNNDFSFRNSLFNDK